MSSIEMLDGGRIPRRVLACRAMSFERTETSKMNRIILHGLPAPVPSQHRELGKPGHRDDQRRVLYCILLLYTGTRLWKCWACFPEI